MQARTNWRNVHSGRGFTRPTVLLAVVAIAVVMLLPSVSGQLVNTPSVSTVGLATASPSTPGVTGASVLNQKDSLTLPSPGALNVFGMATGGNNHASTFSSGDLVTATDKQGNISAAIGVTQLDTNGYTTKDLSYSIGGVGVTGFQYYGEKTKVLIPPVQSTSTLTEKLTLPEAALIVVVALSGGQTSIVLKGIPGLSIVANGTGGTWSGILIGQAQLKPGTYTLKETTTNHDAGGTNRADAVGIFAFSNTQTGFIDKALIRVVATIPVSNGPEVVAYDSGKGEVFVGNIFTYTVSVINAATNTVATTIAMGAAPTGVAYDSGKGEIFVAVGLSYHVSVINDTTDTVMANIPVGTYPVNVAYDSAKGYVYVVMSSPDPPYPGAVAVINDTTDTVAANISVGDEPYGIAYDSGRGELFVANGGSRNVSVISDKTDTVVDTFRLTTHTSRPGGIAYDAANGEVFIANAGANSVSVISDATNKVVEPISVGSNYTSSLSLAYDGVKGVVFVSWQSGNVSVISCTARALVATIPVGGDPWGLAYDSENGEVFVASVSSNTVSVISDGTS